MSEEVREEMIATLILWTGWARSAFENLTDREIIKLHDRHAAKG